MNAIWKYRLKSIESQILDIPVGFRPLSLQEQHGEICMWAEVDPDAPRHVERVIMIGTGWPYDQTPRMFLGTVQQDPYVWHFFIQ